MKDKKIQQHEYYIKNIDKRKAYLVANKDKIKECNKQWQINNKEYMIQYRAINKEKIKQKRKNYKSNKKEEIKRYELKRRYNVTPEQYNKTFSKQEGKCAICYNEFKSTQNTHVDHNHITGNFRGLLCRSCNQGIGYLKDDIKILKSAIKYLKDNN
jgi:hypothetical protein